MAVETQKVRANGNTGTSAKRFAVVVGVNDYSGTGYGNLSYCAADAEVFYDALLTYCEYDPSCVTLFSDGTHKDAEKPLRSSILVAIANMAKRAGKDDSILFFFAGHGTRDAEDSYLLTQEFRPSVVAETGIPMEVINEYLRQSNARLIMRFFDACHSGRLGAREVSVGPDIQRHFLVEGEGFATLSACKEDQPAHEDPELGHGIFSYCLIKGLSGAAATDDGEVTLSSLSTYTIIETTEITKKLGLPQTPVYRTGLAGDQVLATVRSAHLSEIPATLVKVEETDIEQIRPTPEKIPQFLADIRSLLQDEPLQRDYVAPTHEEKLTLGKALILKIYQWCQKQEQQFHEQTKGIVSVTIKHKTIQACPLNLQLAEYIQASRVKEAVWLRLTYKTEQVRSNSWQTALTGNYTTREVLNGISEQPGSFETAVLLTIQTTDPLMPVCAMVIAVIPS
ncbi:MAG TPA: caspase family protein, partial [Ktedonobacteraceae bacterium]|nr:caspase family protein [Ktedonobacteraceae bacterium]